MSIEYNKLKVDVDLERLRANYAAFLPLCDRVIPIIKSDAYGHGLVEVSQALADDADTFGIGFVHEGVALRESGCTRRILALLGPVDDGDIQALWKHDILAAISHVDQLRDVVRAAESNGPLDISLKIDTGMRRLGFLPEELDGVIALLKGSQVTPVMVMSHLALADEPDNSVHVSEQAARFQVAVDALEAAGYAIEATLANSAGSMAHDMCRLDSLRLGIALYGADPFHGTEWAGRVRGLKPAMSVSAPVMQVHPLKAGEGISYGWTHVAEHDCTVAIIGVGYADNYSRALSNTAQMSINGRRVPILGRVCMQMTAVDVTDLMGEGEGVVAGNRAFLLGGPGENPITPEELAGWWNTITYEVFCLLGMNQRHYI